jgi:D-alanine transaminase
MPRVAYVNGCFQRLAEAAVSIEDRGYQFADGIYEVAALFNGVMLDAAAHDARLLRSLGELAIAAPMSLAALNLVMRETIRRNRVRDGFVYLQVTRGVAPRNHVFPSPAVPPSLVIVAKPFDHGGKARQTWNGVGVSLQPDQRWGRCDIKSIALLPNVLAKQAAKAAGAYEAWLVAAGDIVREGGSTTAWIVGREGQLITHPLGPEILPGVMRDTLMRVARAAQMRVEERAFTVAEAKAAPEAFLTATSSPCMPIVHIDGAPVGNGRVGPIVDRLRALMWAEVERQTGYVLATPA